MPFPDNLITSFSWESHLSPKAILICVHGLGLHGKFYEPLATRLAQTQVRTYALDVRGFGCWQKTRTTVNLDACMDDLTDTLSIVRRQHPNVPIFLMGESMGGTVTLRFTALRQHLIEGLILCAPARTFYEHKLDAIFALTHLWIKPNEELNISRQVVERATLHRGLKNIWLNDTLARLRFSASELFHMQDFFELSYRSARMIQTVPVLIVQGYGDRLINHNGTIDLFKSLPTRDKDLMILGDAEHLIFQSPDPNERAVKIVSTWLDDHCRFCCLEQAS